MKIDLPNVDLPELGQCSFHSPERYAGPDYPGEWDGRRASEERILAFCQKVHDELAVGGGNDGIA